MIKKSVQTIFTKQTMQFSRSEYLMKLEEQYGCHNYAPLDVVLSKGRGAVVWDSDGKQYIDCLSAYSAVNQGHCHPKIKQAVIDQSRKMTIQTLQNDQYLENTYKRLCQMFGYERGILMNSGVEAGETALKMARKWAYQVKGTQQGQAAVLFAKGNFWGRTLAACASSDDFQRYNKFGPNKQDELKFDLVEYNNIEALEQKLIENPNIAAYMLEPIQGENGIRIPDDNYLKQVRELTRKHNVLMIADEIQTGFGRTGKMLCVHYADIHPDIIVLGKSLSGGFLPVSACLSSEEIIMGLETGHHLSNFSEFTLGNVCINAALDALIDENMVANSFEQGNKLLRNFRESQTGFIKEIRGKGLMIGVEFEKGVKQTAYQLTKVMKKNGLLAKTTKENIIRFAPPLIIDDGQVEQISEIFRQSVNEL